jgi:uncharacterized membrane protein
MTSTATRPDALPLNPSDKYPAAGRRPAAGGRCRRRLHWLAVLGLFVLAVVLRCALVEHQAIWGDEAFSLATATGHSLEQPAAQSNPARGDFVDQQRTLSVHELAQYAQPKPGPVDPSAVVRAVRLSDTSPPLYYLLLAYWTHLFGAGDGGLRLFSVACSLAAFPLIWAVARQFGGRTTQFLTLLLYAITPLSVYLSTEGRMYSLMWLMAAANLWVTVRLSRGERNRPWLVAFWVLSSIAGLYTHYFFLYVWTPACAWLLLYPGRHRRSILLAAIAITLLAIAPWYVHLPADMKAWRVTSGWQQMVPKQYHTITALIRLPFRYISPSGAWEIRNRWEILSWITYFALIVTVWRHGGRALFSPRRLLVWAVAVSACVLLVASDFVRGTFAFNNERYVAAGIPAALVLVGIVLARLPRLARGVFVFLIVFLCMLGYRKMWVNEARQFHPVRELAGKLRDISNADDLVLIHSIPSAAINLARYLESPDGSAHPAHPPATAALPRVAT